MKKVLLFGVVVVVAGAGLYFYLRYKKGQPLLPGTTGSSIDESIPSVVPSTETPATPIEQKELVHAAQEFYETQTKKLFSDSPVPIPGDLNSLELSALQNFCSLKSGGWYVMKLTSAMSFPSISGLMMDLKYKEGLINTIYPRSGYSGDKTAYYNGLKSYFKC